GRARWGSIPLRPCSPATSTAPPVAGTPRLMSGSSRATAEPPPSDRRATAWLAPTYRQRHRPFTRHPHVPELHHRRGHHPHGVDTHLEFDGRASHATPRDHRAARIEHLEG